MSLRLKMSVEETNSFSIQAKVFNSVSIGASKGLWRLFRDDQLQNPVIKEQSLGPYKWLAYDDNVWISMDYRFQFELLMNGFNKVPSLEQCCSELEEALLWLSSKDNHRAGSIARRVPTLRDDEKFLLQCQANTILFIIGENEQIQRLFKQLKVFKKLTVYSNVYTLGADKYYSAEQLLRIRSGQLLLIAKEEIENYKSSILVWDRVWIF